MQLGTRWRHGDALPARLPDEFAAAVAEVAEPVAAWTLTWLEGHPVVESDTLPDGSWIRITLVGDAVTTTLMND